MGPAARAGRFAHGRHGCEGGRSDRVGHGASGGAGRRRGSEGALARLGGSVGEFQNGLLEACTKGEVSVDPKGRVRSRLTLNLLVDLFLPQSWDELHEVVAGTSTMRSGYDDMWLEAQLDSLRGPSRLDSGDRVGERAVLSTTISQPGTLLAK